MNKLTTVAGIVLSVLVASHSLPSVAGPHHKSGSRYSHDGENSRNVHKLNMKRMMHHFSQLDLSEEQSADIKRLIKEGFQQSKPKRDEIETLHQQVNTLKHSEVIDEQAIRATAVAIANLRSDIMLANLNKRKQVEALLTEEQLDKLRLMKEKRQKRREARE